MPFLKTLIAVGVLSALGYLGNVVNLPIAFSVDFLFGSIFVIIAVSLFGPLLGGLSALIASSYTYTLWNHPYAIIIFVCEALWVGFFLKRRYTNIVLIDAVYWIVIGLPLVFILYFGVMSLGFQSTAIVFLKQSINGIINALIASILLSHLPLQKWLGLPSERQKVPYNHIISQLTSVFLMIPVIGILLFTNYQTSKTVQTVAGELLVSQSKEATDLIHSWLERQIVAVRAIASLGKDYHFKRSEALQASLAQINSLFPDLHAMFIADHTATAIAFIPAINKKGEKTIGTNFADRKWFQQLKSTLNPVISDVFQSHATVFVPIFAISVPIVEEGKLSGFGTGTINLDKMRNMLAQSTHRNNLIFTVVDQHNNIVCSTNPRNLSLTPIKQKSGGQILMIGKDIGIWTPSTKKNISVMDVWKDATYFVTLPIAGTTWTLLTELPVAPIRGYLYRATIINLLMIFCLFLVIIILSQIISKLLVRTLVSLSAISRDIPEKLEKGEELTWPKSNIAEMNLLIENFKETTQALGLQYQTIKDANIHLEERVAERTTELRESEVKHKLLFDSAGDAIFIHDTKARILVVNPQACERYGYTHAELMSMTIDQVDSQAEAEHAPDRIARLIEHGHLAFETVHQRKDGSLISIDVVARRIIWDGRPAMMSICRDITERKEIEAGLEKTRKELEVIKKAADEVSEFAESLINTVREPLITLDQDLRVVTVSRSFYEFFKVSPEETMGQLIYDLGNKQWDIPKLRELLETILPQATTFDNYEVEHEFATIGRRIMLLNARQIQQVLGKERIILLAIEDITERKEIELGLKNAHEVLEALADELKHTARVKSDFLASMSHELRTPLNAVIGFSQVLQDQDFGPLNEKQKEYVLDILESGNHLLSLINDILDLSKVEAGKMELQLSPVVVGDLLAGSLVMIKEKAMKHGITLKTDIPEELSHFEMLADERKFKQILFNLLSNASKFTPDGGAITLSAKRMAKGEGEVIQVSVKDTGIGIIPENQGKVFESFYQVSGSLTNKTPGTGLGLPLARSFVKLHGGRMWVESEGEGKGSQFYFTLPVQPVLPEIGKHEILLDHLKRFVIFSKRHDKTFVLCFLYMKGENLQQKIHEIDKVMERNKRAYDFSMFKEEGIIVLLLQDIDQDAARMICERIVTDIKSKFEAFEASFSLVSYPSDGDNPEELVEKVKAAARYQTSFHSEQVKGE